MNAKILSLLAVILLASGCASEPNPGMRSLFDGETLDGWSGDPRFWSVEDGVIVGRTTEDNLAPHNTFLVWTDGELTDFDLSAQIMVVGSNNSGIQYRSEVFDEHRVRGYQCDVHENPPYCGMLYEEGGRGIIAQRGERISIDLDGARTEDADRLEAEPVDVAAWHTYRIIARGTRIEHVLDGLTAVVVYDADAERSRGAGVLAFQIHQGAPYEVRIRNVVLRE